MKIEETGSVHPVQASMEMELELDDVAVAICESPCVAFNFGSLHCLSEVNDC